MTEISVAICLMCGGNRIDAGETENIDGLEQQNEP